MVKKLFLIFIFITSLLNSQSWVQVADFAGSPRDDGSVFTIGNKAFCFTGSDGSQCTRDGFVYDGTNNNWTSMASLPLGQERQYATAFSYGNTGYMLTGITCANVCLSDFWMYNSVANTWSAQPNFPGQVRQGACNFVIGDKAYVISGRNTSGNVFNDVWEYNITTSIWTQKNNLPFAGMFRGTAFQINGTGYVCFGLTNNANFNRFIYQYDPLNDSWTQISSIILPSRNYVGCAVVSNKAFLYGGQDSTYNIMNDVHLFNPITNTITTYPGIPGSGRKGGMSFSLNNIFYITTGVTTTTRLKETWRNDQFVGIKENDKENSDIHVFPNPASDEIHVRTKEEFVKAIISCSMGKTIIETQNARIPVQTLPSGFYTLSIYTKNSIINKKIVINH